MGDREAALEQHRALLAVEPGHRQALRQIADIEAAIQADQEPTEDAEETGDTPEDAPVENPETAAGE